MKRIAIDELLRKLEDAQVVISERKRLADGTETVAMERKLPSFSTRGKRGRLLRSGLESRPWDKQCSESDA